MEIIEYSDKYKEDCQNLLVELEEYILSIDKDNLDNLHEDYKDKMLDLDLKEAYENNGKAFIALEDDKAIGLIIGYLRKYDEYDYLDYKCPKAGVISELIVTNKIRSTGIGKELMKTMEDYFKEMNCEYIYIDVFAYNDNAIDFYNRRGYHTRMHTLLKKVED